MSDNEATTAVDRAMRAVHREDFLPPAQRSHAADDTPLPIGQAQTISQPSLVADMTRELALTERSRVLEIGTGSGYQTAILAELAARVFTIERIAELGSSARTRLEGLGYDNIAFRIGDGARGWPDAAPFDAIIVTAAAAVLPEELMRELASNGRMIAPVGSDPEAQRLVLVVKDERGEIWHRDLFGVRFVPLVTDVTG